MDYDAFKQVFLEALAESKLPPIGFVPDKEVLDLRSLDRTCTFYVQPIGHEPGSRFHVSGEIFWRWGATQTARTRSTEEDLLVELLDRAELDSIETTRPRLRVDLRLRATIDLAKPLPMPSPATWAAWSRETLARLETVERLVSDDVARETPDGRLEILAWQGDPEIQLTCTPVGELRLQSIEVGGFQIIELPRRWDDPDREPDDGPQDQLAAMFRRLKAALVAWVDAMDHFRSA